MKRNVCLFYWMEREYGNYNSATLRNLITLNQWSTNFFLYPQKYSTVKHKHTAGRGKKLQQGWKGDQASTDVSIFELLKEGNRIKMRKITLLRLPMPIDDLESIGLVRRIAVPAFENLFAGVVVPGGSQIRIVIPTSIGIIARAVPSRLRSPGSIAIVELDALMRL